MPAYKQNLKNIQLNFKTHTDCNKMLNALKESDAKPGFKSGLKIDKSTYKPFCDLLAYALSNSSSEVNKAKDKALSGPFFSGKLTDPNTFATELKKASPEIAELVGETNSTDETNSEPTEAELAAQKEQEEAKTTQVQARIATLKAEAEAAGGTREEVKEVKLKLSQAAALLRSKNFDQADVALNEVDDLIKAIEPEDNFNDEEDEPLITPAELKGFMKKAANKPHPFACGMSKEGFDYTMNREAKKPKALAKAIKKATGATKLCWGTAELNGKTLMMSIQKKPIPGMLKHMKKWLKANKPLPANKAKFIDEDGNEILPSANEMAKELQEYNVRVTKALKDGGDPAIKTAWQALMLAAKAKDFATAWDGLSNLDELLDATTSDVEKQWLAQEEELMGLYEEAMTLNPENRTKLTAAWEMARESADGGNYAKAMTIAAKLKPALEAVLGGEGSGDQSAALKGAITEWENALSGILTDLQKVEKRIADSDNPRKNEALIELKAVRSQLSGTPDTTQKVAEMEKYLQQDDVVNDVCDLAQDIRTPLLAITAQLRAAL